jgi:hypothetical protein
MQNNISFKLADVDCYSVCDCGMNHLETNKGSVLTTKHNLLKEYKISYTELRKYVRKKPSTKECVNCKKLWKTKKIVLTLQKNRV